MAINHRTQEERAREDLEHRCQVFRERLAQPDFLANKGIGNEIGFYTFCYDPSLEFEVRAYIEDLQRDAECGALLCNLKVINLYDAFLTLCENKRILKAISKQELKTGHAAPARPAAKDLRSRGVCKIHPRANAAPRARRRHSYYGRGRSLSLPARTRPPQQHACRLWRRAGSDCLSRAI